MQSPFPGIDPFIEACGLWEDFHSHLIEDIYRDLAARVPRRYVVRTGERNYIALLEEDNGKKTHWFKPDVGIATSVRPTPENPGTAALADPELDAEAVTLRALVAEDFRESFVEIYTAEPERRLVTCIEVLSPSNKRKGSVGWEQYGRKRQALLLGEANLVEIDLLRGGDRMPMADPWPDSPGYLLVARKSKSPYCRVWPAHFDRPLPSIPIPLEAPDADVRLELQPMIAAIYERSRYADDIDYAKPVQPPLPAGVDAWLQEHRLKRPSVPSDHR